MSTTPAPRVLISDDLSPAAVQIFKDRGVAVDVKPGLAKDELEKIIGDYDGLAIRSATKVTEKLIAKADKLKVVGRAGIGVDNVDIKAATAKGIIVMNTPFGNSITTAEHAITLMLALARQIPSWAARPSCSNSLSRLRGCTSRVPTAPASRSWAPHPGAAACAAGHARRGTGGRWPTAQTPRPPRVAGALVRPQLGSGE